MTIQELIKQAGTVTLKEEEIAALKERGNLAKLLFEAQEKQDFSTFYEALLEEYQIESIHEDIKAFIEATAVVKKIKGPACLRGISEYLDQKLRGFDGYLANFPALYINSDTWVMFQNAKVVTLHHDATFYEIAYDWEQIVSSRQEFLEKFSRVGSFMTFRELLLINLYLGETDFKGCFPNASNGSSLKEEKLILQAIKKAKNLTYEELGKLVNLNDGSGYLYETTMEFFDLLHDCKLTITDIDTLEE